MNAAGRRRARRTAKAWTVSGGLFLGLILLLCVAWAVIDQLRLASLTSAAVLAGAFVVGLAVVIVASWRMIGNADTPAEVREARAGGLAGTGTVLEIEETGWKKRRRGGGSFRFGPTRREYSIRLRVTGPDQVEYEGEAVEYLTTEQVPERGSVVPLRVHPQRPDVVVLDLR